MLIVYVKGGTVTNIDCHWKARISLVEKFCLVTGVWFFLCARSMIFFLQGAGHSFTSRPKGVVYLIRPSQLTDVPLGSCTLHGETRSLYLYYVDFSENDIIALY